MNIEALERLTEKVEAALSTIRALRGENHSLQEKLGSAQSHSKSLEEQLHLARQDRERIGGELEVKTTEVENLLQELQRKEDELAQIRLERETRSIELTRAQETLREKEEKIQAASARLEQVMNALELELDVRIPHTPVLTRSPFAEPADLFGNPSRD